MNKRSKPKAKTMTEQMLSTRRVWEMNPKTRVHDNNKNNKVKDKRNAKREISEYL